MALILRVDVDKPYGKHTLLRKIGSKFKEDYFPNLSINTGYLSHLKSFIKFCNKYSVRGHFYHRLCTIPDKETINLLKEGGHKVGLHLENSRSEETFAKELITFRKKLTEFPIEIFSKHGSGIHKLGKYHYPPYEPAKYKSWAKNLNLQYPTGNSIAQNLNDLIAHENYFENLFWMEPDYRSPKLNSVASVLEFAKSNDIVVLIHPCNYIADQKTREDFEWLVKESIKTGIKWKIHS